jgi:AcrR family transcriptional regulator
LIIGRANAAGTVSLGPLPEALIDKSRSGFFHDEMTDSTGPPEPVSVYGGEAVRVRGPRRRLRPDDRRRALMVAALRLFRERSYDQVSVDDIAAAAGMSRPLLYHYYGGKLGVFVAALRQTAEDLLVAMRAAAERSPQTWLSAGVRAYLDHVDANPIGFSALIGHGSHPAGGESVIEYLRERILGLVLEGLRPASQPPMLRSVIKGWIGMVEVISGQWMETGQPDRARLEGILVGMFDAALETTARHDPAVREALRR